jgi:phenylacetate-CoA ligase
MSVVPATQAVTRIDPVLSIARSLEITERWSSPAMQRLQASYSARLLEFACSRVPYYAERKAAFGELPAPHSAEWRRLPMLSRAAVLQNAGFLRAPDTKAGRQHIYKVSTSGSTGEPVVVWRSESCRQIWEAIMLREHRWHGRDDLKSLAVIRAGLTMAPGPGGKRVDHAHPFERSGRRSATHLLDMSTDISVQARWLERVKPGYLLTYPANLAALLEVLARGHGLSVAQVIGVGGSVSGELRARCRDILGCEIAANYSSQEVGYMALGCAHCGQYHVQAEGVVLEVLDVRGEPCRAGETGRIVVTDLHNDAMPLIRYDIGDYATVGEPCPSGIGLPSLAQMLGRRRNLVVHADGRRHWPLTGFAKFRDVAPVLRYQVVQHDLREIELRVAVERPLASAEIAALSGIVSSALAGDFHITVTDFVRELPEPKSGKFEEFVSHIQ